MQFKQRLLIAAGLMASLVPAQAFVQVRTLHDGWKVLMLLPKFGMRHKYQVTYIST